MTTRQLLMLFIFIIVIPIIAEEKFNPDSVRSRNCRNSSKHCGRIPLSQDEIERLPQAESNFIKHRGLPSSVNLSDGMPPIGFQGNQNSCVGWASTYGIFSYHMKKAKKWQYGSSVQRNRGKGIHVFSPAWTYNQINEGKDDGAVLYDSLVFLQKKGAVSWSRMPYSENNYRYQPSSSNRQKAKRNRIIVKYAYIQPEKISAYKYELSKGNPVFAGVNLTKQFENGSKGVIDSTSKKYNGGHAIIIVGYDDNKLSKRGHKGAFLVYNSWGLTWSIKGYGWVSYKSMVSACDEAYSIRRKEAPVIIKKKDAQPPRNVWATKGSYKNKINVSWSSVPDAVAYIIQRKVKDTFSTLANSRNTAYDDYSVQKGLTYHYRIITVTENDKSNGSNSPVAQGYTLKDVIKTPPEVTGLAAHVDMKSGFPIVKLVWNPQKRVKYMVGRFARGKRLETLLSFESASYRDTSPAINTVNTYRVRAINKKGKGPWSRNISVKIGGYTTRPGTVTGMSASKDKYKNAILVKWNSVPSADIYYLYRYDYSNRAWDPAITVSQTSYKDLVKSSAYYAYCVKAKNSAGRSENFSKIVFGKANPYLARGSTVKSPSGVKSWIDQERKTITINWNKVKKAYRYYVFRKNTSAKKFDFIARTKRTWFKEKIPGKPGEIYLYTIRAKAELGESPNSRVVSAFVNKKIPVIRYRFVKGDGLNKFKGIWKSSLARKDKDTMPLEMKISGSKDKFKIVIKLGKIQKELTGIYAAKSNFLKTRWLELKLLKDLGDDIASMEILPGKLTKKKIKVVFIKQK